MIGSVNGVCIYFYKIFKSNEYVIIDYNGKWIVSELIWGIEDFKSCLIWEVDKYIYMMLCDENRWKV